MNDLYKRHLYLQYTVFGALLARAMENAHLHVTSASLAHDKKLKAKLILETLTTKQKTLVTSKPALQNRKKHEFAAIILGGFLLSLNAGYLNAVTILSNGFPVSHVTGTISKAGIAVGAGQGWDFFVLIMFVFCFIFGSTLTGMLITYDSFHLGRSYNRVFMLGSSLLTLALIIELHFPNNLSYDYLVCIACGLQNAMTTRYSGNVLRTTHMTGAATDIGIVLGRIIRGRRDEAWRLGVLIPLMIAFLFGGIAGQMTHEKFGRFAILVNILLFTAIGVMYGVYIAMLHKLPIIMALLTARDIAPNQVGPNLPPPPATDKDVCVLPAVDADVELGHIELVEDVVDNPVHGIVSDVERMEASGNGYSSLATVSDRKDDGFGKV